MQKIMYAWAKNAPSLRMPKSEIFSHIKPIVQFLHDGYIDFKWVKYNPFQNIIRKIKRSSKFRQGQKTLVSGFAYFLSASAKSLFYSDIAILPKTLSRSAAHEATHT